MIVRRQPIEIITKEDYPKKLIEKGYIFEIKKIKVRVGNVLTCLDNMLRLAKNTESIARLGKFNNQGILSLCPYTEFDFTSRDNKNCRKLIISDGNYIDEYPFDKSLYVDDERSCLKYLKGIIIDVKPKDYFSDRTLVIHMRSGDIFKKKFPHVHPEFYQPPLSFYTHIIENGKYSDILITTEHSNYINPIIKELMSIYSNARISSGDLASDINIMLNAKNFVCARSSLSFILSRMNDDLKYLYLWEDKNKVWQDMMPKKNTCLSRYEHINIRKYSSDSYIQVGEWKNTNEQIELMKTFPVKKLEITDG